MQKNLCLETLGSLDRGSAGLAIDHSIREALRDLDDRGKDGKKRVVMIELEMELRPNGQVEVEVSTSWKAPKRHTDSTVCNVRMESKGQIKLLFQDQSPENPDQRTIDEVIEEGGSPM